MGARTLGAVPAGNPTRVGAYADRNRRPPCRRSLRRQISFRHLTVHGLIVTALTIAVSAAYVRLHSLRVLAGMAAELFDPERDARRHRTSPPRS
ncbi:hypothetical protein ABZ137_21585 [Streptomyces bobili]|uniref:hypothetical protein n=1 Tax=Streptomyces bobili TaxID=67280 RepID=UPI0033AFEE77